MPRLRNSAHRNPKSLRLMPQKISYCLVTSRWDDKADAFVDTYHKDKLYDLTDKTSLKALALDSVNYLAKGFKLKLITYVDRDTISFESKDLFK